MATINKKPTAFSEIRLAGGAGLKSAKQDAEGQLRRCVMACLLWEDSAYVDGISNVDSIKELIPQVPAEKVAEIAVQARKEQKLRHVPLLICREMLKYPEHKKLARKTLEEVITRPDQMTEFLSIYWSDNDGKNTLANQVKLALGTCLKKFNEYQLAKWNRNKTVKLKTVLKLCRPKPDNAEQEALWSRLLKNELATPDTWEVGLSAAKTPEEKKLVWENLISENKLGAKAFLMNLRNMLNVNVDDSKIRQGLLSMNTEMLLPLDFVKASQFAPQFLKEIEQAMFRCAANFPKIKGKSIFVVDVSGSMGCSIASKSAYNRLDVAASIALLATEMCEDVTIYATAGSDGRRVHATEKIENARGFDLINQIKSKARTLGGGGIFTRQCLEHISKEVDSVDRIIVFSDSQDCDIVDKVPKPFGQYNYIVDVSNHRNGINYKGVWTAEISGWSESFLTYISHLEQEQ